MIAYVTVRQHFNAGHRLHSPSLSDEENRKTYGKCNLPSGHGHNYVVELTLRGEVDPALGAFVNADQLGSWLWTHVLEAVDHHNLNTDVPFLAGRVPTSENLAHAIFLETLKGPYGAWLWEVRLFESENNVAICRRDEGGD